MRISQQTRFPHPVLSEDTQDYTGGEFSFQLRVTESRTTGTVSIECNVKLSEPAVEALVHSGQARIGVFVACSRTYYSEHHDIGIDGPIVFSKGELRDRVVLRPLICAAEPIAGYTAASLHEEFGGKAWSFKPSDVLALGPEAVIHVGLDKLAPMDTIFNLEVHEEVPDGETRVSLEKAKIGILANKATVAHINRLRATGLGRLALLNGVYLPAVMEVLAAVGQDQAQHEGKRWFVVFSAKCAHEGVAMGGADAFANAQKLLRSPLGSMLKAKEFNS